MAIELLVDAGHLRATGRMFGYPECCIEEFIAELECGRSPALERMEQGWDPDMTRPDGYVPCVACALAGVGQGAGLASTGQPTEPHPAERPGVPSGA